MGLEALKAKADEKLNEKKEETPEQPPEDQKSESDDGETVLYSSHPVANFGIGPYRFKDSELRLSKEEAAKFDELLKKVPAYSANTVKKLDRAQADRFVKSLMEQGPSTSVGTQQFRNNLGG